MNVQPRSIYQCSKALTAKCLYMHRTTTFSLINSLYVVTRIEWSLKGHLYADHL